MKFDAIENEIEQAVQNRLRTNNYGIELEFLGFKKIGLPESVTQTVFDRMKSERQVLISLAENTGKSEAQKIQSAADADAAKTIANAQATATRIRAEGEAEAAKTLPIFEQNPDLAVFLLRIDAIKQSLNQRSTLFFDERMPPFDLFRNMPTNAPAIDHERRTRTSSSRARGAGGGGRRFAGAGRGAGQQLCDCQNRHGADGASRFSVRDFSRSARRKRPSFSVSAGRLAKDKGALLGPGLHWSFPYPIDEVGKIPITEIQKVTSTTGWYFTTPEQELSGEELPAGASLNPAIDGYAITADRNIVHTRATLNYHIEDPIAYIFNFASASNSIQNALNNALLFTAAKFNVDDILTRDVAGFQDAVLARVSDLTEQEHLGIVIDNCQVQSVAPRQLQDVFARVTEARQNQSKQINDANTYRDKKLLNAAAQASAITTGRRRQHELRQGHPGRRQSLHRFAAGIRNESESVRAAKSGRDDGAGADERAGQILPAGARRWPIARIEAGVEPRTAGAENGAANRRIRKSSIVNLYAGHITFEPSRTRARAGLRLRPRPRAFRRASLAGRSRRRLRPQRLHRGLAV